MKLQGNYLFLYPGMPVKQSGEVGRRIEPGTLEFPVVQ
jgi:hypothetical protein